MGPHFHLQKVTGPCWSLKTISVELERRTGQEEIYLLEHSWGLYFKDKQASTSISLDLVLIPESESGPVNFGLSLNRIPSSFKIKEGRFCYFPPVMIVSWDTEYSWKLLLRETVTFVALTEGWVPMQTLLSIPVVSEAKSWVRKWEGTHYVQTLNVCSMKSRWQNEKGRDH